MIIKMINRRNKKNVYGNISLDVVVVVVDGDNHQFDNFPFLVWNEKWFFFFWFRNMPHSLYLSRFYDVFWFHLFAVDCHHNDDDGGGQPATGIIQDLTRSLVLKICHYFDLTKFVKFTKKNVTSSCVYQTWCSLYLTVSDIFFLSKHSF